MIRYELNTPYRDEKTPAQFHVAMSWAQRLKRVFTNSRCSQEKSPLDLEESG
jgi:hypothetical protein